MSDRLTAVSLASRSPRRKELLESIGLEVVVIPSDYDEGANEFAPLDSTNPRATDPGEVALRHAAGKAERASPDGPRVLVAADTLVVIGGQLLGKPRSPAEAAIMLRKLAGREHRVYTGFSVVDRAAKRGVNAVESTAVRFIDLSDAEIAAYVATGDPLDKAGAYGIQGRGGLLVASIAGDFYTVMGLPLARVGGALRELGYHVL